MKEYEGKTYYSWDDYNADIEQITHLDFEYDHVVSIYRGSLVMGTHISNVSDVPLSIIKFQTRDGSDETPHFIMNQIDSPTARILVVDDIVDSGLTMKVIRDMLENEYPHCRFRFQTLFGNEGKSDGTEYLREQNGKWIVFPWEV